MNQNVEFRRNQDVTVLPSSPTQPSINKISSRNVHLSWQFKATPQTLTNLPILSYTLEYYSPEWTLKTMPGWEILAENISPLGVNVAFVAENLEPDTYYAFIVRARNAFGYGAPSQRSDFIKTSGILIHFIYISEMVQKKGSDFQFLYFCNTNFKNHYETLKI